MNQTLKLCNISKWNMKLKKISVIFLGGKCQTLSSSGFLILKTNENRSMSPMTFNCYKNRHAEHHCKDSLTSIKICERFSHFSEMTIRFRTGKPEVLQR